VLRVVVGGGSGFGTVVIAAPAPAPVAGRYAPTKPASAVATRNEMQLVLETRLRRRSIRAFQLDFRVGGPLRIPRYLDRT
jgi:hypothetical protein